MPKEFTLPDLGEGITEAQIIRVLIRAGDRIEEDQYLMEVETDKAAVEIPSPYAGIAKTVHVKEGQTVNVGDVIVTFDQIEGGAAAAVSSATAVSSAGGATAVAAPPKAAPKAPPAPAPPPPPAARRTTSPAAPVVRKLARELGVDLDTVTGSGPGGRVTKEDVKNHVTGSGAAAPLPTTRAPRPSTASLPGEPGTDKWGPIRSERLSQIRKTIAKQMTRSAFTAVHVTHGDEADITELDRMRRRLSEDTGNDPKVTVMSFVIRATCAALRKYPMFNASYDEENGQIIYKDYVNMGIAVDTERGLIVPVLRNADQMTLRETAHALRALADQIRTNQFAVEDLRGGSFTITNVGALGGTFSTPIINPPEVAILGLGRSRMMPVIRDGKVDQALVLPVNLSFDHRATDGANAARFTSELVSYLENPAKFLLD